MKDYPTTEILCTLHAESFGWKAILVSLDGDENHAVWLPRSQIEYDEEARIGDEITVTIPEWLAAREGLI